MILSVMKTLDAALTAGQSSNVGPGTALHLTSNCSQAWADFALGPDGILRHQYSGLCVGVNPSAPASTPPPPPPRGAAIESAVIGVPAAFLCLLLSSHLPSQGMRRLCTSS